MKKFDGMRMFGSKVVIISLAGGLLGAGCDPVEGSAGDESGTGTVGETNEESGSEGGEAVLPVSAGEVLSSEPSDPVEVGLRSCTKQNDCVSQCECAQGKCALPDLQFGPFSPPEVCNKAPVLTPPDAFENDNTWQQWKAYGGPQIHNFHHAGDEDWAAVYFPSAAKVSFRTVKLTGWGADPKLEVYKFLTTPQPNGALGPLVGAHDDIGGSLHLPDRKGARVDINVAAGSAYLVRVTNNTPQSSFDTMYEFPRYTLDIRAQ